MKKYFITGLVILLPLALIIAIVIWVFNLLTTPFVGLIKSLFTQLHIFENGFLIWTASQVQQFVSQIIILALLFLLTITLGIITRWFLFRYLVRFWDYLIHKIPLVSSIYKTCQDVINTIFTSKDKSFKQVVMVPFPNPNTYTIGLVTRDNLPPFKPNNPDNMVAVFVPTTPNPTSGFLVIFKDKDLIYLDMPVESALKYIISCGVIATPFKSLTKEEARAQLHGTEEIIGGK